MNNTIAHLGILLLRVMAILPFSAQVFAGKRLGGALKHVLHARLRISKINIAATNQPEGTLSKHWESLGIGMFETANSLFSSEAKIHKLITVRGRNVIDELVNNNENIILLAPHTTHTLLTGRAILTIFNTHNVYRPQNNEMFNHHMTKSYTTNGATLINTNDPKSIIRAIKSKTPVWYAPDHDLPGNNVFVDFFGVQTSTLTSTQKLANITNAKIVPISFIRHNKGYYLEFKPPISMPKSMPPEQAARLINKTIEGLIAPAPDQYYWVHRRFKTRPEGFPPFY